MVLRSWHADLRRVAGHAAIALIALRGTLGEGRSVVGYPPILPLRSLGQRVYLPPALQEVPVSTTVVEELKIQVNASA